MSNQFRTSGFACACCAGTKHSRGARKPTAAAAPKLQAPAVPPRPRPVPPPTGQRLGRVVPGSVPGPTITPEVRALAQGLNELAAERAAERARNAAPEPLKVFEGSPPQSPEIRLPGGQVAYTAPLVFERKGGAR